VRQSHDDEHRRHQELNSEHTIQQEDCHAQPAAVVQSPQDDGRQQTQDDDTQPEIVQQPMRHQLLIRRQLTDRQIV
jgi:hypothetical protein